MPSEPAHSSVVRHGPLFAVAALVLLLSAPRPAGASEPVAWKLDPVHTRVMFAVSHAGFSRAIGTVSGSDGGLLFDPGNWTGTRLVVEVPMTRIDLGDADWNRAALAGNLLDGAQCGLESRLERHPQHAELDVRDLHSVAPCCGPARCGLTSCGLTIAVMRST